MGKVSFENINISLKVSLYDTIVQIPYFFFYLLICIEFLYTILLILAIFSFFSLFLLAYVLPFPLHPNPPAFYSHEIEAVRLDLAAESGYEPPQGVPNPFSRRGRCRLNTGPAKDSPAAASTISHLEKRREKKKHPVPSSFDCLSIPSPAPRDNFELGTGSEI